MFKIRFATEFDKKFWFKLDEHLRENEFIFKIQAKQCYLICDDDKPIGVMRYNLFWDMIPFLNLIYIDEYYQNKGFGKKAILFWENEMQKLDFKMVMTSTRVDEDAQHFYRKLGYKDKGSIFLDNTLFEQPQELILIKVLNC